MNQDRRYLPLYNEEGKWISRPDLYVLIRMSVTDSQGESVVSKAYRYVSEISDNTTNELDDLDAAIQSKFIRAKWNEREFSAMVVTELLRLDQSGIKPTVGKALRLVTRYSLGEKLREAGSVSDQAERAFRKWRNTCHLETAFRMHDSKQIIFENDVGKFDDFLADAKALERFMDEVSAHGHIQWNPWRIPDDIKPGAKPIMEPLSSEERELVVGV